MERLEGKLALVTGGANGIGAAICAAFAKHGARVAVTDIEFDNAKNVAAEINATRPGSAFALKHDATSEADWKQVLDRAVSELGGLNVLVNNVGGSSGAASIEDLTFEHFQSIIARNLHSTFLGCKLALPHLKKAKPSSIVNMSSMLGLVGAGMSAGYCAAKGGVRLLTKSVALHCAQSNYGVRCNSVHPTFIRTRTMVNHFARFPDPEAARHEYDRMVPIGRMGEPEEVAAMVVYLASDESSLSTGAEFVVDGGQTAA